MRTNDERIAAMHTRAAEIRREKNKRRNTIIGAASVFACFIVVIAMGFAFPRFATGRLPGSDMDGMNASIFSGSDALGYIVIGILAFLLGAAVTVFCMRLRRLGELNDNSDKDNRE